MIKSLQVPIILFFILTPGTILADQDQGKIIKSEDMGIVIQEVVRPKEVREIKDVIGATHPGWKKLNNTFFTIEYPACVEPIGAKGSDPKIAATVDFGVAKCESNEVESTFGVSAESPLSTYLDGDFDMTVHGPVVFVQRLIINGMPARRFLSAGHAWGTNWRNNISLRDTTIFRCGDTTWMFDISHGKMGADSIAKVRSKQFELADSTLSILKTLHCNTMTR